MPEVSINKHIYRNIDGQLSTCCDDCVFFQDKKCFLGRHEKGMQLEQVTVDDKEFNVVKGRLCNTLRTPEWVESICVSLEEAKEIALKEAEPQVSILIPIDSSETMFYLETTLLSLMESSIPPVSVHIIFNTINYHIQPIKLASWCKAHMKIPWSINKMTEPMTIDKSIDHVEKKILGNFYTICHTGLLLPKDFIYNLHHDLNIEMKRIIALRPVKGRHLETVSVQALRHHYLLGNSDVTFVTPEGVETNLSNILDKISYIITEEQEGKEYLIGEAKNYV